MKYPTTIEIIEPLPVEDRHGLKVGDVLAARSLPGGRNKPDWAAIAPASGEEVCFFHREVDVLDDELTELLS